MSLPPRDDLSLIDDVLAGSPDAFGVLVERYQERLFRLLGRFALDRMETEDLAQEAFVKAYRKLHTFQRGSTFYTWLYRITVNAATDYLTLRKRRRLHLVDDPSVFEPGGPHDGATGPLLDQELREVTRRVLATLPDKYRTILILREYEDLSYTDMAQVLGCSIGTVESRLFRARQRFKDALERTYPDLVPKVRGGVQ